MMVKGTMHYCAVDARYSQEAEKLEEAGWDFLGYYQGNAIFVKVDDTPRPMVQAFAQRIEAALQAVGDDDRTMPLHGRLSELLEAANTVSGAMADASSTGFLGWDGEREMAEAVIAACVDVAVWAMWLANGVRPLEVEDD